MIRIAQAGWERYVPGRNKIKEKITILGKHFVEQFSLTETGQIPV